MWYPKYKEYEEDSVRTDYEISKQYLDELYGETTPAAVYLRKSQPKDPLLAPEFNYPLCEPIPEKNNEFAIYLTLDANSNMFLGQLAHEVAHLKNAYAMDLYIEGINTNFGRKLYNHLGKEDEWLDWEDHYANHKDPLYADTYFLIKELEETLGHDFIAKAFEHLERIESGKSVYRINLNNWLNELDLDLKKKAVKIFKKHENKLSLHRNGKFIHTQLIGEIEA
ncbi:hypothetical protein NX625_004667 [Vibrio parahaemolyticus]|nr:hypothetical protein [Vibrio parahaemolyticus]